MVFEALGASVKQMDSIDGGYSLLLPLNQVGSWMTERCGEADSQETML